MNLYSLSDKIVFNILKDIDYGYLEIKTYQGRLVKFGNKDETLKASICLLYTSPSPRDGW